jgi:putative pyruvate formate lyase activating enzyme
MWRLTRPDSLNILDDPKVRRAMPRYVDVVRGKRLAKFIIARNMAVEFSPKAPTGTLWELHSEALQRYGEVETQIDDGSSGLKELGGETSFLDLKLELGRRVMTSCHFCERRCGVDRFRGRSGYCRCGTQFSVSSCFPHMGEEPELIPSGTVFTCGCSIRCLHCQNWSISQWGERGQDAEPSQVASVVESLIRQGCRNVNMVGGDPTPNCWLWLRTMREVEPSIATVWNSNSYYSRETSELLASFIDLYLLDLKYGNDDCAAAISDAPGYWEAATRNHLEAKQHGELLIRVLVLPGHNECCTRPILEWISGNLGPWTRVNLMFQYRPEWRAAERPELRRRLTRDEINQAIRMAKEAGLENLVRG